MRSIKKYLITLLVGLLGALLIVWMKDIFVQTEAEIIFHILSDAFFVVGVVTACSGLLIFSSNEGTFDMLVYGMGSFVDLFRKKSTKKYETFYDYKVSREGKKVKFGFLLLGGATFIAVAFIMYFIYRQYI